MLITCTWMDVHLFMKSLVNSCVLIESKQLNINVTLVARYFLHKNKSTRCILKCIVRKRLY